MVSAVVQRLRVLAPLVASGTVVLTLVTCVILAKARDVYTGGLKWPYFSDMGRDSPGYYVFCVGLSVVALALMCTWYFNYQFQRAILRKPIEVGHASVWTRRWAFATAFMGIISVIGLPMLSFFSTASYSTLHNSSAYWFFFLETIAIFINTIVSYKIFKVARKARSSTVFMGAPPMGLNAELDDKARRFASVKRTFYIQATAFSLFFIAFLLYLPIGLAVVQSAPRLTIQDCLAKKLGEAYCTKEMRYTATLTKLWNYEGDFGANQMRSAGQLGCILTLVGYSISFLTHDYTGVVDADEDRSNAPEPSRNAMYDHAHPSAVAPFVGSTSAKAASAQLAVVDLDA